jgi:hypothetical protein
MFAFSELTLAQSNFQYEYDQNNKLKRVTKNNVSYMKFEYDQNGNLTKKTVLLPPPQNVNAQITANGAKLSWDEVPGAIRYHIYLKNELENESIKVASTEQMFIEFRKLNFTTSYSFVIRSEGGNGYIGDEGNVIRLFIDVGNNIKSEIKGRLLNGKTPLISTTFSVHSINDVKWYDTITNRLGIFTLNLPDGEYQIDGIWLDKERIWYERNQRFTVFNGQLVGELLINLEETKGEFAVTGTLNKGVEKLPNVHLSVYATVGDKKVYETKTDHSGNFSLQLPQGSYHIDGVWVDSENQWYEIQKQVIVQGTTEWDINVFETTNFPFVGTLVKGELSLANVTFYIRSIGGEEKWYDLHTDVNGNFNSSLQAGTYLLEGVWLDSESTWYELQKEIVIDSPSQMTINVLDLIKGNVIGTLTKGTQPIPNRVFSINSISDGKWYNTVTDGNGKFEFTLPNGTYMLYGVWIEEESKWYELNLSFIVNERQQLNIDLLDPRKVN